MIIFHYFVSFYRQNDQEDDQQIHQYWKHWLVAALDQLIDGMYKYIFYIIFLLSPIYFL